jgi:Histidine phosphatase superfamily (branch 2)
MPSISNRPSSNHKQFHCNILQMRNFLATLALLSCVLVPSFSIHFGEEHLSQKEAKYVKDEAYEVEFVGILTRHGVRTPKTYYVEPNQWGDMQYGDLLPEGMRQHSVLGQLMRQRYTPSPLPAKADPTLVYAVADSYQRTHLSAMSFMNGLFPEYSGQTILSKDEFVAVPPNPDSSVKAIVEAMRLPSMSGLPALLNGFGLFNIDSFEDKNLMFSPEKGSVCKSSKYFYKQQEATEAYQNAQSYLNATFWQKLVQVVNSQSTQFNLTTGEMDFEVAIEVFDTYLTTNFIGLENIDLPQDLADGLLKTLEYEKYNYEFGFFPMINASVSLILGDISSKMEDIVDEKPDSPVFALYSGHDHNFYAYFQLFLGIGQGYKLTNPTPRFAANLVFELLKAKSDGHYYVRVLYDDLIFPIQACSMEPCPLDEFELLVSETVIEDLDKFCSKYKDYEL